MGDAWQTFFLNNVYSKLGAIVRCHVLNAICNELFIFINFENFQILKTWDSVTLIQFKYNPELVTIDRSMASWMISVTVFVSHVV